MRVPYSLLAGLLLSPPVLATDVDIAAGAEYFIWEEFADSGKKLLDETGPRYFVALVGTNHLDRDWSIDFGGRVYSGTVDFDGETGSGQPVSSDSDYNGYRVELGFVHFTDGRRSLKGGEWLVRFAVGTDRWRRRVQDSELGSGSSYSGYVQRYTTDYATLGLQYRLATLWSFSLGAKAPFYITEELDRGTTVVDLRPQGNLSAYAAMELRLARGWALDLHYDSYRFAKSDPNEGEVQPEIKQDAVGMALHYRF